MMFSQYHNTHRKFKRLAKALIRLRVQMRDDARGSLRLAQDVITS